MNRSYLTLAISGVLMALLGGMAQAQTAGPGADPTTRPAGKPVLPKHVPPPRARSVLGVPVVHPPATGHRRRPPGVYRSAPPVVELPSVPKPPLRQAAKPPAIRKPGTAKAGAAATAGAAAGAAGAALATPGPAPAAEPPKADPNKGTVTGLPLPRWVSFRSDDVNLRSGPGTQYPIDWQYHRRNLPVQITREFDQWRLMVDPDGIKGWVHQATLTGRRGFMIKDAERTLRRGGSDDAAPVALLKPGVVGYIRSCAAKAAWCDVQAGTYRGWLARTDMYGVEPDEAIN